MESITSSREDTKRENVVAYRGMVVSSSYSNRPSGSLTCPVYSTDTLSWVITRYDKDKLVFAPQHGKVKYCKLNICITGTHFKLHKWHKKHEK